MRENLSYPDGISRPGRELSEMLPEVHQWASHAQQELVVATGNPLGVAATNLLVTRMGLDPSQAVCRRCVHNGLTSQIG